MDTTQLEHLAILRAVIGYLGEREQHGWWPSAFLSPVSPAFLSPVFGRTQVLAQVHGVTRAASLVHDERIGIGQVYHLFRLPEDIEQGIHHALHSAELGAQIGELVSSQESAMTCLSQEMADTVAEDGLGPVHVGNIRDLRDPGSWGTVVAHYVYAFGRGIQIYPYFAERP